MEGQIQNAGFTMISDIVTQKGFFQNQNTNPQEQKPQEKISVDALRELLIDVQTKVTVALQMLGGVSSLSISKTAQADGSHNAQQKVDGQVIEGVFDGEHMVGQDGKEYLVPPNYASKSKLVEGDMLKLIITSAGAFIYKQLGPIDRTRIVGKLKRDHADNYFVESQNKEWRVLTASVTYFKGNHGDEVAFLIPETTPSRWAAVENIISKK